MADTTLNAIPGEDFATYEARVGGGTSVATPPASTTPTPNGNGTGLPNYFSQDQMNSVMSALSQRLMNTSGAVSSQPNGLDTLINQAIQQQQNTLTRDQGGNLTQYGQGVAAPFELQKQIQQQSNVQQLQGAEAAQRGYGTNLAVLNTIQTNLDKQIKMLDMQEQQALASGQAEAAGKISDLKVQQITQGVNAQNQAFQNMLSMAGVQLQSQQLAYQIQGRSNDQFSTLISSGALANLTPADLMSWSQKTGIPYQDIQSIQDRVKKTAVTNVQSAYNNITGQTTIWGLDRNNQPTILGTMQGIGSPINPLTMLQYGNVATIQANMKPNTIPTGAQIDPNGIGYGDKLNYIDLTQYSGDALTAAMAYAKENDLPTVNSPENKNALDAIAKAKLNLQSAFDAMSQKYGTNWATRYPNLLQQKFSSVVQTDPELAAMLIFKDPALQNAISQSGITGGRFGTQMAGITSALDAYLQPSDTLATAMAKAKNISELLDNGAKSILGVTAGSYSGASGIKNNGSSSSGNTWNDIFGQ